MIKLLTPVALGILVIGFIAVATRSSTVTPEGYETMQCNSIIDYMSQQIGTYELQLRALRLENDKLRNELEGEET